MACLRGTVGVAPGSYTLQLGAPCVLDSNGPVAYGIPSRTWYAASNAAYSAQFVPGSTGMAVPLSPYGTQSTLKGASLGGIRLDVLGVVVGLALGVGLAIHRFAKR